MKRYRLYNDDGSARKEHAYWISHMSTPSQYMYNLAKQMVEDGADLVDISNFLLQEMYTVWGASLLYVKPTTFTYAAKKFTKKPTTNITMVSSPAITKKLQKHHALNKIAPIVPKKIK